MNAEGRSPRRLHVRAFHGEAQDRWFEGMEGAFRAFGGVPEEVGRNGVSPMLFDNARALVERHDPATREVVFDRARVSWTAYATFAARCSASSGVL